jgi:ribosome-binding factor A
MANRTPSSGPSQRQLRVGELIRRTLSDVLAKGMVHDPDLSRFFFTVGEVRTTPDLKLATAFVLPLGGDHRAEALEALRRNRAELRRLVGRELTLKYAPDLRFEIDETYDRIDESRRMFTDPAVARDLGPEEDEA